MGALHLKPVQRRFFFPLHLKLMLTYLGLAAAILAVSSAFAWREAQNTAGREISTRMESSFQQVRQELDRRLERSLAVVNLAAMSPELTAEIASRGVVELGPNTSAGTGFGATYGVRVQFISNVADYLPPGEKPPVDRSISGLTVLNGRPQAAALSPVSSASGTVGYLLVLVDAFSSVEAVGGGSDKAFWLTRDGDKWKAANGQIVSNLEENETQVRVIPGPEGTIRTVYHPVRGFMGRPLAFVAIEGPDKSGPGSRTSPLLGLAVLTVSVGLFVAHYLARLISRPVEEITEATERVAAGDIAYQLPLRDGKDELAVLAGSFNSMTRKYSQSRSEVEEAARKLEQTVVAQDAEIQMLFGISRIITSILDVEKLLEQVLDLSMPLVGGVRGTAWLRRGAVSTAEISSVDEAEFDPVVDKGQGAGGVGSIYGGHPLIQDLKRQEWRVCVFLPGEQRQVFYASKDEKDPYRKSNEPGSDNMFLSPGDGEENVTRVVVPLLKQHEAAVGVLQVVIPGNRPLTEHEAMLIYNVMSLASVAVANAGLYGLVQKRGEQVSTLLRETHHRITNNLAAISGVLSIQLSQTENPDTASLIEDNLARIASIAQVHRLLTGEMKDEVELTGMLEEIARSTITASGSESNNVGLSVSGPSLVFPAKQATSVAVITNELIINSLKHGFPTGREQEGLISIAISKNMGVVEIYYRDNGAGVGEAEIPLHEGMGTRIINNLVRDDLGGTWSFQYGSGYEAKIQFPAHSDLRILV